MQLCFPRRNPHGDLFEGGGLFASVIFRWGFFGGGNLFEDLRYRSLVALLFLYSLNALFGFPIKLIFDFLSCKLISIQLSLRTLRKTQMKFRTTVEKMWK